MGKMGHPPGSQKDKKRKIETPIISRSTGQMTTSLRFRSLPERIILFVALQHLLLLAGIELVGAPYAVSCQNK